MSAMRQASGRSSPRGVINDFASARKNAATVERGSITGSPGLSSEARGLARALRLVEVDDEARTNRVRVLREQIADGTYRPDPREVAKRLIQSGF